MGARQASWVDKACAAPTPTLPRQGREQNRQIPYLLPQHNSVPTLVSLLSTPFIGLSLIKVTPVSV